MQGVTRYFETKWPERIRKKKKNSKLTRSYSLETVRRISTARARVRLGCRFGEAGARLCNSLV